MNCEQPPNDRDANAENVGDRNVERLLTNAYRPEMPDPAFVQQATAAMLAAAKQRTAARVIGRPLSAGERLAVWAVAAGLLVGLGVVLGSAILGRPGPQPRQFGRKAPEPLPGDERPAVVEVSRDPIGYSGLVARRRTEASPAETLAVGGSLQTTAGQRRRVSLEDGSILYLNHQTEVTIDAARHVTLLRGEIFVEVSPQRPPVGGLAVSAEGVRGRPKAGETPRPRPAAEFVVATPDREITALGTKFDVRLSEQGTRVVVTQGKVQVSGMELPILAGQQLAAEVPEMLEAEPPVSPAPRVTHVIGWTRDLMASAESPLVPASRYSGGALIAVDPNGQEAKLSLRKYHVDVYIEDGFARTTIDQTYFNHLTSRLEGTFFFPLPPDASLSRLAMYVGGKLREGGMAERQHARQVFEEIVRTMKDPALLEWVDGSTFKMRVFPLEGRQEKRIILSYTQKLPSLYRETRYRFPGGHNMQRVGKWSARLHVKDGTRMRWQSDSHDFQATKQHGDLILEASAEKIKPDRDVVLTLYDPAEEAEALAATKPSPRPSPRGRGRFSSAVHEGSKYLMLRWRPELPAKERRRRRDWIFLFESSADRDPVLARVQVDVVKTILENAEHEDTFSILTAGTRVHVLAAKPQAATGKNIKRAVKFLEQTHLVGALDLGRAIQATGPFVEAVKNPVLVHLGSGVPILGEKDVDALLRRIPKPARYIGVGVGKRWSRTLMKAAAARTGGYFTQINPDEQVNWRALDLLATLNTSRLLNIKVADIEVRRAGADAKKLTFLCHNDMLADGEELCAIARFDDDRPLPHSVVVTGLIDGKPYRETIAVGEVAEGADYLPRTWAKLEIDRLVALGAVENQARIIELSKAMYVISPFTSLLVLENEQMYRQYNVDRGRKDHWALYPCPEQIEVVHEPLRSVHTVPTATETKKPSAAEILRTVVVRIPPPILHWPNRRNRPSGLAAPIVTLYNGGQTWSWSPPSRTVWVPDGGTVLLGGIRRLVRGDGRRDVRINPGDVLTLSGFASGGFGGGGFGGGFGMGGFGGGFGISRWYYLPGAVQSAAFSPDGRLLAPAGRDSYIRLWNAGNGIDFNGNGIDFNGDGVDAPMFGVGVNSNAGVIGVLSRDDRPVGRWQVLHEADIDRLIYPVPDLGLPIRSNGYFDYFQGKINRLLTNTGSGRETPGLRLMVTPRIIIQENEEERLGIGLEPVRSTFERAMTFRDVRQRGVVDFLYVTELAHVPFSDEPPIVYPDAEVWQALAARRGEKYASLSLASWGPATRAIIEALSSPTRLEFTDAPLEDVVHYLKDYHDIEIEIDRRALDDSGLAADIGVTCDCKNISLRSALRLILRKRGLTYVIDNDVLLITTPEELETELVAEYYPPVVMRRMQTGSYAQSLSYRLPDFENNWNIYYDLLSYAPGMQTSVADVLAILEAELPSEPAAAGKIDPRARKLIEKARGAGWQTATVRGKQGEVLLSVDFDGTGRCRYERTTGRGLREQVLCDGTDLWHLYPELGIGARRSLSRFHRGGLARLVPWVLPPAEELARGAELKLVDKHTVAIVPQRIEKFKDKEGKPQKYAVVHLIFAADGRLAERRLLEMPSEKTLLRQVLAPEGSIKWLDGEGKVLLQRKIDLEPCGAPELKPDGKKLVILPMPLRIRDRVNLEICNAWSEHEALRNISSALLTDPRAVTQIITRRFFSRGDRRLGFYVLLIANGYAWDPAKQQNIDNVQVMCDPLADHPGEPLAEYVADYLRVRSEGKGNFGPVGGPRDGLLRQLAEFRNLWTLFGSGRANRADAAQRQKDRDRALKFIRRCKSPELGWALLTLLRDQGGEQAVHRTVAEAAKLLQNVPGLAYFARYERARATGKGGDRQQAQKLFEELYRDTLRAGFLPPIDSDFRRGLEHGSDAGKKWAPVIRGAVERLLAKDARVAAIRLAWQVHHLGDPALAEEVFNRAYGGNLDEGTLASTLAAVEYLWHSGQHARADRTLRPLLEDERYAKWPALWRLASMVAEKRGMTARALGYTERAMEIEYENLPEVVNVRAIRNDYGGLLNRYGQLVTTIATLHARPPQELLGRIIRVADRWRSLETDPTAACHAAAKIFADLGAADLGWDYLTTPLAARPNEAAPWQDLAEMLRQQAQFDLADRAYALAFEAEPQNAQILWDRARVLLEAGRRDEAGNLLRRIADGDWPPQFNTLKSQARQSLQ